eukprot:scaffold1536_cov397-Prasinococcus_capsulatus_cf.AAC.5
MQQEFGQGLLPMASGRGSSSERATLSLFSSAFSEPISFQADDFQPAEPRFPCPPGDAEVANWLVLDCRTQMMRAYWFSLNV